MENQRYTVWDEADLRDRAIAVFVGAASLSVVLFAVAILIAVVKA